MQQQPGQDLKTLSHALSEADLSTLQASVQMLGGDQPVNVTTTAGSGNDLLWAEMAARGWMSLLEPLESLPNSRVYRLNPAGKEPISQFLAETRHSIEMTKIINDLRQSVPPWLIETVHRVDGVPADLAIMLAGIVESTMRRAIKPELHDEFLQEVMQVAQKMRSN